MNSDPSRRALLGACFLAAFHLACRRARAPGAAPDDASALDRLAALERTHGGRLGVAVLETGSGRRLLHRADERFPMCSTFKFLAAAQVLQRVDRGAEHLERRVVFPKEALVIYSPVTEQHTGAPGMTLGEVCHAAVTVSDNTAGNLLLASGGGPEGFTAFLRSLGDSTSRLDRIEPFLNEALPGDPRDTTTPAAMLEDLRTLLLGEALSAASRAQLAEWLVATTTGATRLRAGLPEDWRAGDKTGTGANGVTNDVAIAWPPGRAPVLVAAYFAGSSVAQEVRNGVLAEVGRIAADFCGGAARPG
jgi:beta-lactamase class A